jgi:hypothetical protein
LLAYKDILVFCKHISVDNRVCARRIFTIPNSLQKPFEVFLKGVNKKVSWIKNGSLLEKAYLDFRSP